MDLWEWTARREPELYRAVVSDMAATIGVEEDEVFVQTSLESLMGYWMALSQESPLGSAKLSRAFATRLADVLPQGVSVRSFESGLSVSGVYGSSIVIVALLLQLVRRVKAPGDQAVRFVLCGVAHVSSEAVARQQGAPWPAAGAEPFVQLMPEGVRVYWAHSSLGTAVLALRPFALDDLPADLLGS
jgi:hypothetical protein